MLFRSALASLHICPASELTPAILKAWIQSQKTTLKTIRNQLSFLRSALDEAAESLALGYWKTQGLVILPQALKLVIPGLVNTIIALFKDTSLVIIIGLFDLFSSVQQATVDPAWLGMSTEGYVFAALIYWIFCFSMSRYSQHLEKRFNTGRTPQ